MKAEYLPSFIKDLKALRDAPEERRIRKLVFDEIESLNTPEQLSGFKRLRGYRNAYRLRVGDYRVGFFFDGRTLTSPVYSIARTSTGIFHDK